jgi:hypothetical protein
MKVTHMETGKCSPNEIGFLKSLGWKVIDAWRIEGSEPVDVLQNTWDRYAKDPIIDDRYDQTKDYMDSYWKFKKTV